VYLLALGGGLLLEGGLLLLLEALPVATPFSTGDPRHNALHVAWGSLILAIVLVDRAGRSLGWLATSFGVFYSGLAIAGVLIDQPFGLLLGPGENAFHFSVGPLALVLGLRAVLSQSRRPLLARPARPPHSRR
jgi:hypothetical protein